MTMKIGVDSYCFHRFFGEVYPEQPQPPKSMTLEDFIGLARELSVDGVSLESCFIPPRSTSAPRQKFVTSWMLCLNQIVT